MNEANAKTKREFWTDSKYDSVARYMIHHNMAVTIENVREAALTVIGVNINLGSINTTRVQRVLSHVDVIEREARAANAAAIETSMKKNPVGDLMLKNLVRQVVVEEFKALEASLAAQLTSSVANQSAGLSMLLKAHLDPFLKAFGMESPAVEPISVPVLTATKTPSEPVVAPRKVLVFGVNAGQRRQVEDMLRSEEGEAACKNIKIDFVSSEETTTRVSKEYHVILYMSHFIEKTGVAHLTKKTSNLIPVQGSGTKMSLSLFSALLDLQIKMEEEREAIRIARS